MTGSEVLGRQPVTLYITPSKPNPWYGSIVGGVADKVAVSGGERFTAEQLRILRELGLDPAEVEAITVTRNATQRELYWSRLSPTPQFQFDCPVLDRRADGRISIIAPAGLAETVDADGFVGRAPATKGKPKCKR